VDVLKGIEGYVEVDLEEDVDRPLSREASGKPCRIVASSCGRSGKALDVFNEGLGDSSLPLKVGRWGLEKSSRAEASGTCRPSATGGTELLLGTRSLDSSEGL
jgi:hypothetical protein